MKKLLLFFSVIVLFVSSCSKEVVPLEDAISFKQKMEQERINAEQTAFTLNEEKRKKLLDEMGYEKLAGKCDCFYRIIKGTAREVDQPFIDLELVASTQGRCDGNPLTPDCHYFSAVFSENPNGFCGAAINPACVDEFDELFPTGVNPFNCEIEKGSLFSIFLFGAANSADCTEYSAVDGAKLSMEIICSNLTPDECTRGGGGYSIASPPFTLSLAGTAQTFDEQGIFLDCECEPKLVD